MSAPLSAIVPPLRERRWEPAWQQKILQGELLELKFLRRLLLGDPDYPPLLAASALLL